MRGGWRRNGLKALYVNKGELPGDREGVQGRCGLKNLPGRSQSAHSSDEAG